MGFRKPETKGGMWLTSHDNYHEAVNPLVAGFGFAISAMMLVWKKVNQAYSHSAKCRKSQIKTQIQGF